MRVTEITNKQNMSDLLICLAHFCDKHGPRVLMVTQCATDNDQCQELLLPDYPTDSYCESCLIHFPESSEVRSMRSTIGSTYYVSTQYSSIRYQLLTSITKRTFSEETMTYDGTPLVFYDDMRGCNFVIGFKLQDVNARGSERRYCLILTIDSRDNQRAMSQLSQNWEFIVSGFAKIIEYTRQKRAEEISKRQRQEFSTHGNNLTPMVGNYLRGSNLKIPKNLTELTSDSRFFLRLHKWNAFMLDRLNR